MIIGIGIDLVDIKRINKLIDKFGKKFIEKVFSPTEINYANQKLSGVNAAYAKRFAAKEACLKALGTGFAKGISWHDINISNNKNGKPEILLTGKANELLAKLTPFGYKNQIHLTISDEFPYAQAMVIIEALSNETK